MQEQDLQARTRTRTPPVVGIIPTGAAAPADPPRGSSYFASQQFPPRRAQGTTGDSSSTGEEEQTSISDSTSDLDGTQQIGGTT
eukprot:GSA120T00017453001.1